MRKNVLTLTAAVIFAWQGISFAGSSVDTLIQKLEDKGILTAQEATQIKGEIASNEKTSQETSVKTLLPEWLNSMKITGDFRLRDQWQVRHLRDVPSAVGTNDLARNRGRFRARVNFEDQVNDKLKVIAGIATNGESGAYPGNSRSNNITFGGNGGTEGTFNKSAVVWNKAYAIYTPNAYITLMGGQMDNPIWEPASLLWDPDITPTGGAVQLQKRLNDYITPFSTNAMFIFKDSTPSNSAAGIKTDPYIYISQEGIKGNLTEKVYYKAAGSFYNVSNPTHIVLDNSNASNTISSAASGTYSYNYYLVGGAVDLGINDPLGELLPSPLYIPQAGVFGQYFKNLDPSHQNSAWMMGAYVGSSSINGFGTWKVQSYYKVLERDSWLDALPDDDFYSGNTNTEGWRNQLDIGLAKNVWFTMSYFHTNVFKYFKGTTSLGSATDGAFSKSAPEDLFQMDLNFKF